MAFLSIDNRHDLPKVSYSTAIDYFLAVCFAFVFASILQFATVHFFTKNDTGDPVPDDSDVSDDPDDKGHCTGNGNHTSGFSRAHDNALTQVSYNSSILCYAIFLYSSIL